MIFKKISFLTILAAFTFLSQSKLNIDDQFLKVIRIKDGDTIVLLDNDSTQLTVRLSEIDAPEIKQTHGLISKKFLIDLIADKKVKIQKNGKDPYGRTLCFIFTKEGLNINLEMVEKGMAWQYYAYSKSEILKNAQERAKKNKLGLWADYSPIPPWEFRKIKKNK